MGEDDPVRIVFGVTAHDRAVKASPARHRPLRLSVFVKQIERRDIGEAVILCYLLVHRNA